MTTFTGAPKDRSVTFINGSALNTPISLTQPMRCEGTGYATFASSIRSEAYKRLGIADSKNRYLIISLLSPGVCGKGEPRLVNMRRQASR